jgi:hypothetical protein
MNGLLRGSILELKIELMNDYNFSVRWPIGFGVKSRKIINTFRLIVP